MMAMLLLQYESMQLRCNDDTAPILVIFAAVVC